LKIVKKLSKSCQKVSKTSETGRRRRRRKKKKEEEEEKKKKKEICSS
jgi:hypothetical protein